MQSIDVEELFMCMRCPSQIGAAPSCDFTAGFSCPSKVRVQHDLTNHKQPRY